MSTTRSTARRPRRPAAAKHDPDGINELELFDEARLEAAHRRRTTPQVEPIVLVSEAVLLLTARAPCLSCGAPTPVNALAAMPEFETDTSEPVMLRRIKALPPELDKAVRHLTHGRMRPEHSRRAASSIWLCHCKGCGAKQPEPELLGELGPFQPSNYAGRAAIKLERIVGPFAMEDVRPVRSEPLLAWLQWRRNLAAKRAAKTRKRIYLATWGGQLVSLSHPDVSRHQDTRRITKDGRASVAGAYY